MATILTSSQQTFVDITDQRKLSAYITSNLPKSKNLRQHFIDGKHLKLVKPIIDVIWDGVACMICHDICHVLEDFQIIDSELFSLFLTAFIGAFQFC